MGVKGIQGGEEVEVSLLADDMTVFMVSLELINIFRKVAGYQTNTPQTSSLSVHQKETHWERNYGNNPLEIASKLKYLGINLAERVKDVYSANFRTLKMETEDTRRWRGLLCAWIKGPILWKGPFTDSMQASSKFQHGSFQKLKKNLKFVF